MMSPRSLTPEEAFARYQRRRKLLVISVALLLSALVAALL